jgi:hypothetical protein
VGVVTFGESQRILEPVAMNFGHSDVLTSDGVHRLLGKADRELGDFRPGRYMWRAHSARTLNYPIAQRGYQGAFALPRAVRLQVLDALAAGEIVKP